MAGTWIRAGVSTFAITVGLSVSAFAQTSANTQAPVAPLAEIEAAYADDPVAALEALERALDAEMEAVGIAVEPATGPEVAAEAAPVTAADTAVVDSPAPEVAASPIEAEPASYGGVELPAVPSAVMSNSTLPDAMADLTQKAVITMRPGTTELIAVAEGHLNRIVTPFAEPTVVTTSDAKYRISGNVIYVATTAPATLYVTPKGDESVALPLALVPRRIPPREITLHLGTDTAGGVTYASAGIFPLRNKAAEQWEQSQPYVETIRTLFRDLALGKVPQGYQLSSVRRSDGVPDCVAPEGVAFHFDDGQVLRGGHLEAVIGIVTNSSSQTVELLEPWCGNADVAAVAFWPQNMLAPGASTEVFVVRRPYEEAQPDSVRPSLLVNAGGVR